MTPRRKKDENGTSDSSNNNKNTEDEGSSKQEGSSSCLAAIMEEREKDKQLQQQNKQHEVEDSTTIRIDRSEDSEEDTSASASATTTTSHAAASGSNLGRRGDPRMHKAVSARLSNPGISLLEALVEGGFNFPNDVETCGKSDRDIYDSEGVQLCQRKNQLSRRLRLIRKREKTLKSDNSTDIPDTIESIVVGNSNSQNMINQRLALLGVQGERSNLDMMLHQQQSQRLNGNLHRAMQPPCSTSHTPFPPEVGSHIPNLVLNNNNKRLQIEEDNAALLLLEQQSRAMKLLRTNNGNPAALPSTGIPGNLRGGAAAGAPATHCCTFSASSSGLSDMIVTQGLQPDVI